MAAVAMTEGEQWQLVPYGLGAMQLLQALQPPQALLQLAALAIAQRCNLGRKAAAASVFVPAEAVSVAMQFMDADTLCAASEVCRDWRDLASQDALWTHLCRKTFGVCPSCIHPAPKPVKSLYVHCSQSLRDLTRGIEIHSLPTIPRSLFF